jgi:hypothetical protein
MMPIRGRVRVRVRLLGCLAVVALAGPACGGDDGAARSATAMCEAVQRIGAAFAENTGSPGVRAEAARVAATMRDVERAAPEEIRDVASTIAAAWSRAVDLAGRNDYDSSGAFFQATGSIFGEPGVAAALDAFGTYVERNCTSSIEPPVTGSPATGSRPPVPTAPGQVDWQSGTELARTTLASGAVVRFVETKDGRYLCFVRESRNSVGVDCSGVPPVGAQITSPSVGPSGSVQDGWHYLIALPGGFPAGATVRDEDGRSVAFARATDGRFVVTTTPDTRSGAAGGPPARAFEVLGADGNRIARASFGGAPTRATLLDVSLSAGGRVRVLEDVANRQVCVEGGIPLATPASGTGPTGQAISACFGYGTAPASAPTALPAGAPGAFSVYYVIVLPQGFASPLTVRDTTGRTLPSARTSDGAALVVIDPQAGPNPADRVFELVGADGRTVASVEAKRFSPTQSAVRSCLEGQGLVLPDTGAASVRLAPDRAAAAWKACRDVYAASVPASEVERALSIPDCMAADGWLVVVVRPGAAESAAFNAAIEKCGAGAPTGR